MISRVAGSFSPRVSSLVRRLLASLTIWICLIGMVQPALACGLDCCPKRSPAPYIQQTSSAAIADDCCCARSTAASSPWVAAQPRKAPDQVASSPVSFGCAADTLIAQRPIQSASVVLTDYRGNQSLTYLRTARLRL